MKNRTTIFIAAIAVLGFLRVANATQGDDASITIDGHRAGPSPFIANVQLTLGVPSSLASIRFTVVPKSGSVTRPIAATYMRRYLEGRGKFDSQTGKVSVPVFGLYDNYTNTVILTYSFGDGSSKQATTTITTAAFDDPCEFNNPTVRQVRTSTNELSYDLILVASSCGPNSPTVIDTDGAVRWVGTAGATDHSSAFYQNAMYQAEGSRLLRIELDGTVSVLADYSSIGVLRFTHNLDPGRHGLIGDVDTVDYVETENIEVDATGKVVGRWNPAEIIGAAMTAGGDDPGLFIRKAKDNYSFGSPEDWWHNNSVVYRPSDNSLVISSRENFVMAVDYETSAIKWIFGDASKQWYQFPSLRQYALAPGAETLAPDGQHSVSFTHDNHLLLMDNGRESQHHQPAGPRRKTAARKYSLNLEERVATELVSYPDPPIFSTEFCSSIYEDAPFNYLLDYAQVKGPNGLFAEIVGLTPDGEKVFDYSYPTRACEDAYRSLPLHWENLVFETAPDVQLVNISTRSLVKTGDDIAIGGFIVTGTAKPVVLRGIGPSLQVNGAPLSGRLMNPTLALYDGAGVLLERNDNYEEGPDTRALAAANLTPADDREAAIIRTLPAGAYTAVLRGQDNTTGLGLVEVYDVDGTNGSKLANLSTRALVSTGDNVLIGGAIVEGINRRAFLFRAIGPELEAAGVPPPLQDTTMRLINADGEQIASNDDWRDAQNAAAIEQTGAQPKDDRESAILTELAVGSYTVIVQGKLGGSGTALVEAYQID